jgi:chorismate mutase
MLDLAEIRLVLDQYSETIISRLKDRSRQALNKDAYVPDAVMIKCRQGISFLEFAVEQREIYYASIGRYEFADQTPLIDGLFPIVKVERLVKPQQRIHADIGLRDALMNFYINNVLHKICRHDSEPDNYGVCVDLDTEVLENINARINLGRHVADHKLKENSSLYDLVSQPDLLRKELTRKGREFEVIEKAREIAARYKFDEYVTAELFLWMMERTKDLEVEYIRQKTFCESKKV